MRPLTNRCSGEVGRTDAWGEPRIFDAESIGSIQSSNDMQWFRQLSLLRAVNYVTRCLLIVVPDPLPTHPECY